MTEEPGGLWSIHRVTKSRTGLKQLSMPTSWCVSLCVSFSLFLSVCLSVSTHTPHTHTHTHIPSPMEFTFLRINKNLKGR